MSVHGVSLDRYVNVRSPIHSADARLKCGGAVVFIVAVTSLPVAGWTYLGAFCAGIWLLALLSRTGLARTARRSLIAVPFILVAVPSIFSVDGRILQIWELGPVTLTPTHEGLMFVATLMLKGWIAVTASVVLASTTRYLDIAAALRWFRVPAPPGCRDGDDVPLRVLARRGGATDALGPQVPVCGAAGPQTRGESDVAGEGGGPDGRFALHQDAESRRTSAHGDGTRGYDGGATAAAMRKLTAGEAVVLARLPRL